MLIRILRGLAPTGVPRTYIKALMTFYLAILPINLNTAEMTIKKSETRNFNNLSILIRAMEDYGNKAIKGNAYNSEIVEYLRKLNPKIGDDDTPWCSAFLYSILKDVGIDVKVTLAAKSWLKVGDEVLIPQLGDIAVFWRKDKNSWQGHCGIFVREGTNHITILGGNQMNMVQISLYNKIQLLGYRRFTDGKYSAIGTPLGTAELMGKLKKSVERKKTKTKKHGASESTASNR